MTTSVAHPDLNELLDALLSMAQTLLEKQGEFYPIGAIMLSGGEIRHVGAKIEGDDHPSSQSLIDLLTENFQKDAAEGKLRAAGICFDGLSVPPGKDQKQDAICCGLEYCLGDAVDVFTPKSGQRAAISTRTKVLPRSGYRSSSANCHALDSCLTKPGVLHSQPWSAVAISQQQQSHKHTASQ